MSEPKRVDIGLGLAAWGEELKGTHPDLAAQLKEPRSVGYAGVDALDLPSPKRLSVNAKDILNEPETYFGAMATERVFVFLQPKFGNPTRRVGVSKDEALAFIREALENNPDSQITVELSEYLQPKYGGNILVKKDGAAMMEFGESQGAISAGTVVPEFRAWQDTFTGLWRYFFPDVALRTMVQNVMREVPHDDGAYLPGMYEFNMVPDASGALVPWFVDYRASDAFVA